MGEDRKLSTNESVAEMSRVIAKGITQSIAGQDPEVQARSCIIAFEAIVSTFVEKPKRLQVYDTIVREAREVLKARMIEQESKR